MVKRLNPNAIIKSINGKGNGEVDPEGRGSFDTLTQENKTELLCVLNALTSRAEMATRLGMSYNDNRNLYKTLGYSTLLRFEDYHDMYSRQDMATRIVEAIPTASWLNPPTISETEDEEDTEFEAAFTELLKDLDLWHYMSRIDKLSGIGQYGILLLGFDGNKRLSDPVKGASQLLYIRPHKQNTAEIETYVIDKTDPRYGLPEMYKIQIGNFTAGATFISTRTTLVHWTRVIHIADDLKEDDIYGTPRLKNVFNRLMDLEKVAGGSAEMFWRGAFPGLAFILDAEAELDSTQTTDDMKDQINSYIHGLQRTLQLQGMKVQNLAPRIADPSKTFNVIIALIAAAKGIPVRILLGSERGELASTQDETAWNKKIEERRDNYVAPRIIRPFIDRLILLGILPTPTEYFIKFPDISVPTNQEKAEVMKLKTESLAAYANSAASEVMPLEIYLRDVMEVEKQTIQEIMDLIEEQMKGDLEDEVKLEKEREELEGDLIKKGLEEIKKEENIKKIAGGGGTT